MVGVRGLGVCGYGELHGKVQSMAYQFVCDGCGNVLHRVTQETLRTDGRELVIQGERVNSMGGARLPQGRFHWCERCARIAFKAVEDAKLRAVGMVG
jgi:hypothetical protein